MKLSKDMGHCYILCAQGKYSNFSPPNTFLGSFRASRVDTCSWPCVPTLLCSSLWTCLQGDVFCWLEVLSAVNTPRLKDYTTKVADLWLTVKLKVSCLELRMYSMLNAVKHVLRNAVALDFQVSAEEGDIADVEL